MFELSHVRAQSCSISVMFDLSHVRAQSCSCSIEISDTYIYMCVWPYVKLYAHVQLYEKLRWSDGTYNEGGMKNKLLFLMEPSTSVTV